MNESDNTLISLISSEQHSSAKIQQTIINKLPASLDNTDNEVGTKNVPKKGELRTMIVCTSCDANSQNNGGISNSSSSVKVHFVTTSPQNR